MSSSLTGALSWAVFGDFSGVAAGAVTLVVQSEYARDAETAADDMAVMALRRAGLPSQALADAIGLLQADAEKQQRPQLPHWMRVSTDYLSSHPPYPERIAHIRRMSVADRH